MLLQDIPKKDSRYLLALHSSSSILGVGVIDLENPEKNQHVKTFEAGRDLSNNLITYVQELLPRSQWRRIDRIAVALGPGSFTGTRITLMMARTIAQQISCHLDGFSSFALMAPRFAKLLEPNQIEKSFWIKQSLARRGIIAAQYLINHKKSFNHPQEFLEISSPSLIPKGKQISPAFIAAEDVYTDTVYLLELSLSAHRQKRKSNWENMLPIYPTSPVDKIQ